jgi:Flp pilus assembly protein TadG
MTETLSTRAWTKAGHAVRRFSRLTRRFRHDQRGANAVEFGIVALPFFALVMAIIEAAMVFFAGQVMETGLRDAARLIRTGQAHSTAGFNQSAFKTAVCQRIPALLDCSQLSVDVRTYTNFSSTSFAPPTSSGNFDPAQTQFNMGTGGSIVVARAFYSYPSFANILGSSLSNQANGRILLVATASFRNEPFQTVTP